MIEITFKKMRDIKAVVVYTMLDDGKKKPYLSTCELGYYDRFERLQWAGKTECKWPHDYVTFDLERPIYTNSLLLKIKGGKSRVSEVEIYAKDEE